MHDDELSIDVHLVRALIERSMPEFSTLELRRLDRSGSSNMLFRLGDDLLVRLPRQPGGTATIQKEARWLGEIGPRLPVPVPEVVAVGAPGLGYPERWSVTRWLAGETPPTGRFTDPVDPTRRQLAVDLAEFVRAVQSLSVPQQARTDPALQSYRGDPLSTIDQSTRTALEVCRTMPGLLLDVDAAVRVWDEAMALPGVDQAATPRWFHGDLLAENLLVRDGRLAAVLDFGGLAVGDPTVDLVPAWEVLDAPSRELFRQALHVDDATWRRARAWALALAVMTFPYYWRTMPERCSTRLDVANSVLHDSST